MSVEREGLLIFILQVAALHGLSFCVPGVLDEVKARSQELIVTFGNATEFCKLFTEDCVFMPTGSDAVIRNKCK